MAVEFSDLIRPSVMLFTIVFYCLLIFVLLKDRKTIFSSSFYSLFASTGIADLLMLCTRVFMMDMPSLFFGDEWLLLSNEWPLATIANALTWYIAYVQIYGLVAISINRFSAVALPMWFNKFWTPERLRIILVMHWFLPMLWILPMIHPCCQSSYFDDDISNMGFVSDTVSNIYSIIDMSIEVLICVPLVIFLNITSVAVSVKNRRQLSNAESEVTRTRKKAELRLAVVGTIISVSYVSSVLFLSLWEMSSTEMLPNLNSDLMSSWYYNSFDTFTLFNPYILLILSGATRTAFLKLFTCKRAAVNFSTQTATGNMGARASNLGTRVTRLPPVV